MKGWYKKYQTITNDLFKEFSTRCIYIQNISNDLSLVSLPFAFNVNNAPANIQLELINLQSNLLLKNQFSEKTLLEFYASLNPEIFKNILDYAQKFLALFGSTYIWEDKSSLMKHTRNKNRSRITHEILEAVLRIATSQLNPNYGIIINQVHSKFNPAH